MGMRLVVLATMVAGCGDPRPLVDYATLKEPVATIWRMLGGMHAPSRIVWKDDRCDPNGYPSIRTPPNAKSSEGDCVWGVFVQELGEAWVAPAPTYHQSALAHELIHSRDFLDYGNADEYHKTDAFKPGGAEDEINARLEEMGW